jgi:hypothetical protein
MGITDVRRPISSLVLFEIFRLSGIVQVGKTVIRLAFWAMTDNFTLALGPDKSLDN